LGWSRKTFEQRIDRYRLLQLPGAKISSVEQKWKAIQQFLVSWDKNLLHGTKSSRNEQISVRNEQTLAAAIKF
jgi:hypothetical protein